MTCEHSTTAAPLPPTVQFLCGHCWHYHTNTAGPAAYERCCWCGDRRTPGASASGTSHGPYAFAFAIADTIIEVS